jgi:hypothetical protein
MSKEMPLEVKVVSIIRNHYASIADELTALLKEQVPDQLKDKPESSQIPQRQLFPKDLEELLIFEDEGQWVKIFPKRFLGSETFARVAAVVRELSGEYVSAGKDSHFKIPKT